MTSRERMLTAIGCGRPDYVPLSFMIFGALRARRRDWFGELQAQMELGLDPMADMTTLAACTSVGHGDARGVPVTLPADVEMRTRKEMPADARYPVLHKEYKTPKGMLSVAVNQTDDWIHGDTVPLLDDYLAPRCTKHLVTCEDDLPALRHLLSKPVPDDGGGCLELWRKGREFAERHGLLTAIGWGVGADALAWLCGFSNGVMMALDRPKFFAALLDIVSEWNRARTEFMLRARPDLFLRRGWYEGTAYWSPGLFRRFLLPRVKEEATLVHEAGAKFGFILMVGGLQFAPLLIEAGVDVLIGIDPVQDAGMRMGDMKRAAGGKMALWGGVNGFVTVERGTPDRIRAAVREALETLGPDGFILSPVDNIRDTSDEVWQKTLTMIEAWREFR
jgi:hypothetical protein